MTVKELIGRLSEYPADAVVCLRVDEFNTYQRVGCVRLGAVRHTDMGLGDDNLEACRPGEGDVAVLLATFDAREDGYDQA